MGYFCHDCHEPADEFYNDEWLCEDCIVNRMMKEEP